MKSIVFISYVSLLAGLTFAQENKPYNTFNKEAELQKFFEQGGKVEEISPDVYKLIYRTGESRTFYIGSKENVIENNEVIDTTIINIWEIDTTKFTGMFTFWQQVEVANLWWKLPIEDLNENGRPELYGYTDYANTELPVVNIFERNLIGIYENIFTYDSTTNFVIGMGDIYGTGNKEICMMAMDEDSVKFTYPIYRSDSTYSLPTNFDFLFYFDSSQINDIAFGDWDNNSATDCAFINVSVSIPTMCVIAEYRDSMNNFEEISRFENIGDASGFAIGDFDLDGSTELVFSSVYGDIFVIESKAENEYAIVNQFQFNDFNAYMHTVTNDIDGNGKMEFWIAGQNFVDGMTAIRCYEANGDNSYRMVAYLELRYLVSLYTQFLQAMDIDGDGIEELTFSIGNTILILKFAGKTNEHIYKVFYAKFGEATQPEAEFFPTAFADLDGDGKKDLMIPMDKYTPSITYAFSYILRQDKTSGITSPITNNTKEEFIQSYPNPFNSENTIGFNINQTSNVQIKIYNSLGKEIRVLLDKELSPGKYEISWYGEDKFGNSLPSGVYLIVLKTKNSVKTFKSILLK